MDARAQLDAVVLLPCFPLWGPFENVLWRKPRNSAEKTQTRRKRGDDRSTSFNKKKEEARAHLDMAARETALKQLGIEDRFEFADQAKIYNAEQISQCPNRKSQRSYRLHYSSLFLLSSE